MSTATLADPVRGSDRVLAPEAFTSPRLFDMAGRPVFTDGADLRSDTYAAWRASAYSHLVDVLRDEPAGEYVIHARRHNATDKRAPDMGALFDRFAPGLSLALAAGTAVPLTWAGVAYLAPAQRAGAELGDPAVTHTCDVWVRADGGTGRGDQGDPVMTNVRYRPLVTRRSQYDRLACWVDPTQPATPLVVRDGHQGDQATALVMPVRHSGPVHVSWADQ